MAENQNPFSPVQEQGISSVIGAKKKSSNKWGYAFLGGALALGLSLAVLAYQDDNEQQVTAEKDNEQKRNITSSRELTTVKIPTREEERAARDAELLAKNQNGSAVIDPNNPNLPYELPSVSVSEPSSGNYMTGERPMTLEEKKFAAPMMGKVTSNNDQASNYANNSGSRGLEMPQIVTGETEKTPKHLRRDLSGQLESVVTPEAYASKMSDRSLTLAKGTMIECILETRVDTSVPAMTSCVIPRDVYSHNGRVLLLERGTRAVGEYQGSVENGLERIFMLWTELRTPNGIVIPIGSPTTDALGAGGIGGYTDHHWWKRFGNALMFSMVGDGVDYAIATQQSKNVNSNVSYTNTNNGISEIVKAAMEQSGQIPPTLIKNQGERVGIFVARDLSFESVYELSLNKNQRGY